METLDNAVFPVNVRESIEVLSQKWGHRAPNICSLNSKRLPYDRKGTYSIEIKLIRFHGKMTYSDIFSSLGEINLEFAPPRSLLTLGVESFNWQVPERVNININFCGPNINRKDELRDVLWFSIWKDEAYEIRELNLGLYRLDDIADFDKDLELYHTESYFATVRKKKMFFK